MANANVDFKVVVAQGGQTAEQRWAAMTPTEGVFYKVGDNLYCGSKLLSATEAAQVTYSNTTSGLTATQVQAAIDELAAASSGGVSSKTIWLKDDETVTSGYLKTYGLYQGANSPTAATNPATLIGKIDIPKDLVVTAGKVVTVTSGVDSDGESTAVADGTYLKLTIANQTAKVYINVADLCDAYTGGTTTEATVAISNTNEITVTVGTIDGAKIVYKTETSAGAGDGETVKQALTRLDGADSVTGSVAKVAKDAATAAVGALDTVSDITVASQNASTGEVTLTGSVKETDGIIAKGTGTDVTLKKISTSGNAEDVAIADAGSYTSQTTVEGALQEVYQRLSWVEC